MVPLKFKNMCIEFLQRENYTEYFTFMKVLEEEYSKEKEELESELHETINAEHRVEIQKIQAKHNADTQVLHTS